MIGPYIYIYIYIYVFLSLSLSLYIYINGAAWNAVVLFLTMVMGKIGIASWPFWLKTRTRIEKKSPRASHGTIGTWVSSPETVVAVFGQNGFECLW